MLRWIALLSFGFALARLTSSCAHPSDAPAVEFQATTDPRLGSLLAACTQNAYYDVDTSNWLGILEATLIKGQADPLKRARVELADAGAEGLAVARRVIERYWDEPFGESLLRNAFDVVSLSKEPEAHDLILRALDHPKEDIRVLGLRAMRTRGTPDAPLPGLGRASDFDRVLSLIDSATSDGLIDVVLVLHDLDPLRANAQYQRWLADPQFGELWPTIAPCLSESTDPAVVAWAREHWKDFGPVVRAYLVVAPARAGDAECTAALREMRAQGDATVRLNLINALVAAQLFDELTPMLPQEQRCDVRRLLVHALTLAPRSVTGDARLVGLLNDTCDEARFLALDALCRRGDERGLEHAIGLLDQTSPIDVDFGMRALRGPVQSDAKLAERVLDRLLARHAREASRPPGERAQLLQCIGQIPLERAAKFLLDLAETETRPIQSFAPHRWLCLHAANTHEFGAPAVLEHLARERRPLERLDLLECLAAPGGERVRAKLAELIDGETLAPYETLYVAERMVTLGPARQVAPLVKRVTLRVQQPDVRLALQCLLWRSYPAPVH